MNNIYRKSRVIKDYSLIGIELITGILSYLLAYGVKFKTLNSFWSSKEYFSCGIFLCVMILLYAVVTDWNRDFFERGFFKELWATCKFILILTVAMTLFLFLSKTAYLYSRLVVGVFVAADLVLTYVLHLAFKEYLLKHYKKSINSDKLMVVTTRDQAQNIVQRIQKEKKWNYELTSIGLMDCDLVGEEIEGIPVIANRENLIEVATQHILDRVFISLPREEITEVKNMILEFESMGILCHYNVEMEELNLAGKEAGNFAGFSVISFSLQNMDYRRLMIKRGFDIVGGCVGLIFTGILFPFIALAIRLESPGPIIFKQERIGKNGRRFKMYKFRSMYLDAEQRLEELMRHNEVEGLMFKMEDDPRITKVGKFIRKTSIDELPQFWNVIKGDMSLVGTRPPTVREFEQYNPHYRRRLCITPGLTGLWQVSGRSDIKNFDEVVKLDLQYIDDWSLRLDIKLLLQTVLVVLFHRGSK